MRHILWCLITACLVLSSTALLLHFDEELAARLLPAPLQRLVLSVEDALSPLPPEHAEDDFPGPPEPAASEAEETEEPEVYEANPRYTVERDPERGEILRGEVQRGDTAGKLLGEWMDANDLAALLAAAKPVYALTSICFGQPFAIVRDPDDGSFRSFCYEINQEASLVVEKTPEGFRARQEEIDYRITLTAVRGRIVSTLSEAVAQEGENVALAIALADIFASEINFITDLREGDSFEVLVEKRFRGDAFAGYGRVLGARFVNRGERHAAYLFHNEQGRETYYDAKGENLRRQIMKAPLSFLRVTSRYSMARRHPVFGNVRPHQGIDYGAPSGTPIMAVGDGVITSIGRAGGYGNQIIIRHNNGLESLYGHMSRFAKTMKKGKRVRQGQTIGYVGATGTATGPHLDFRIRKNGTFVNPGKLIIPRDPGLEKRRLDRYRAVVRAADACLAGNLPTPYDPDAWFGNES
ncbi:M23 family metallopeptidase [uncultured Bilophila sp.]|uniref:M23 family metallopeptidase n=3 Tax=uncultured Bilophila sp. TaxID=529385 RepID=UPI0026177AAE|nr:M23 family metallopeptidase [uncultured Bilophila sp.]